MRKAISKYIRQIIMIMLVLCVISIFYLLFVPHNAQQLFMRAKRDAPRQYILELFFNGERYFSKKDIPVLKKLDEEAIMVPTTEYTRIYHTDDGESASYTLFWRVYGETKSIVATKKNDDVYVNGKKVESYNNLYSIDILTLLDVDLAGARLEKQGNEYHVKVFSPEAVKELLKQDKEKLLLDYVFVHGQLQSIKSKGLQFDILPYDSTRGIEDDESDFSDVGNKTTTMEYERIRLVGNHRYVVGEDITSGVYVVNTISGKGLLSCIDVNGEELYTYAYGYDLGKHNNLEHPLAENDEIEFPDKGRVIVSGNLEIELSESDDE